MESEDSSSPPILDDCPVGGSSLGGSLSTFLRKESRFHYFILDFCTLQNCALSVSLKGQLTL